MEIFIVRDGEQYGPFTDEEVRDYLAEGALVSTDVAWHEGLAEWITLDQVTLHCPPQRTPPPPSRIPPKPPLAQALSPWTGISTPGGVFADSSLLNGFIIIPANLNGELTRENAAGILNEELATPRITQLAFEGGGVERALADGLVVEGRDFELFSSYDFDLEKIAFQHWLPTVTDQIRRPEDDPSGVAKTHFFEITTPLSERVEQVTGITAGPLGSRVLQVEYISMYGFPEEMQAILPYLYTGRRGKAAFQRYDDGWRVISEL